MTSEEDPDIDHAFDIFDKIIGEQTLTSWENGDWLNKPKTYGLGAIESVEAGVMFDREVSVNTEAGVEMNSFC